MDTLLIEIDDELIPFDWLFLYFAARSTNFELISLKRAGSQPDALNDKVPKFFDNPYV